VDADRFRWQSAALPPEPVVGSFAGNDEDVANMSRDGRLRNLLEPRSDQTIQLR
jgi:hypothetical protein